MDDPPLTLAQRRMIVEGVFSRTMDAFTGGVVLAGFAVALGASNAQIGLLAAVPFLAQLANVPAVALLARSGDPRRITVVATLASRLVFLGFAALAFLGAPDGSRPAVLVALLVAYAVVASVGGTAWQVWTRALVPRETLGRYFGRRMLVLAAVGLAATLGVGAFLAWWPAEPLDAYGALYLAGAAAGLVSTAVLARTPGVARVVLEDVRLRDSLSRPLRERNYRRILVFLGVWGFAANLALPFLTVLMLRSLGYGMGTVVVLAAVSQLANLAAFRMWGPVVDRFANKPVLGLGASVFVVVMLVLAFLPVTGGAGVLVVLVAVHVLLGIATAALDLASTGLVLKSAPEGEVASYLASASVVKAVAAGAAPLVGGALAALLAGRVVSLDLTSAGPEGSAALGSLAVGGLGFVFLASAILCLYALHRLLGFDEAGEAPPTAVARALRREVGGVSSVAGMRQFAHVASYVVEAAYRFERAVDISRALQSDEERRGPQR